MNSSNVTATRPLAFRAPGDMFDPPGNADALPPELKSKWSRYVSIFLDRAASGDPVHYRNDAPRAQFYNPLTIPLATDAVEHKVVSWIGFPKLVKRYHPVDEARWKAADADRNVQDEYCEWNVERIGGKVSRVTFTCEPPEYWKFLGEYDPKRVVALYREFISPDVKEEDLYHEEIDETTSKEVMVYNLKNKWNNSTTNGAMHLIQRNNYLSAEIELAAGASIIRVKDGKIVTEQQALIECGGYGQPGRNSDPSIGEEVNTVARTTKAQLTLANPPGLYFDRFVTKGWQTPDNADPDTFWKIVRGTSETPVRAVFEVPKERGYLVGDITINHKRIVYGAQIADFVRVKLSAVAQNFGRFDVPPMECREEIPEREALAALMAPAATAAAAAAAASSVSEHVVPPHALPKHVKLQDLFVKR